MGHSEVFGPASVSSPGPSSAPLAAAPPLPFSATLAPVSSVPAAGVGPATLLPVFRIFPLVAPCAVVVPSTIAWRSFGSCVAPFDSVLSRHGSWSWSRSRHLSPGRWPPSQAVSSGHSESARLSSARSGSVRSSSEYSQVSSRSSGSSQHLQEHSSFRPRARSSLCPLQLLPLVLRSLLVLCIDPHWTLFLLGILILRIPLSTSILLPLPRLAWAHAAVPAHLFLTGITNVPAVIPTLAVRLCRSWGPYVQVPVCLFGLAVRGLHQGLLPGMALALLTVCASLPLSFMLTFTACGRGSSGEAVLFGLCRCGRSYEVC